VLRATNVSGRRACGSPDIGPSEVVAENWGLSELVEPATRCGRTDLATDALERPTAKAQATRTDWALGVAAGARALLGEGSLASPIRADACVADPRHAEVLDIGLPQVADRERAERGVRAISRAALQGCE
jgi:hypothetical protein